MMTSRILIIEDEIPNAERLVRLLGEIRPDAEIVGVIESVAESVQWFNENPEPDVVMMDIRLSDGLSFEIFEKTEVQCPVIFTTAYDEYAVKAFRYNSVYYLLKPIEQDELHTAIEKLEAKTIVNIDRRLIDSLLNSLEPKGYRNRFLLSYRDAYKTLLVNDILYFYSEFKLTKAKLLNGEEEVIPQTLEELEQQLDPKLFFRANRQYIIHIDSVRKVSNYFKGKLKLELIKSDDAIIISREKSAQFKNWIGY
ncbi:LytR/AlgR family response regulator transcription factor [Chryseobacterium sp. CT-SW4]|uniref:LytR/AlgR family response regulator transcription factor n=1 Tax=Chryseobacterium sp. SW-1 TaxID=3157343 RepID=UPI003B01E23F